MLLNRTGIYRGMITDQTTDVLVLIGRRPVDVCQVVKR